MPNHDSNIRALFHATKKAICATAAAVAMAATVYALSVIHPNEINAETIPPGTVTLAWDANIDPTVAGYKLYRGTKSREYVAPIDVGNVTIYTLPVVEGDNYFAVTAYDQQKNESAYSKELFAPTILIDGKLYTFEPGTAAAIPTANYLEIYKDSSGGLHILAKDSSGKLTLSRDFPTTTGYFPISGSATVSDSGIVSMISQDLDATTYLINKTDAYSRPLDPIKVGPFHSSTWKDGDPIDFYGVGYSTNDLGDTSFAFQNPKDGSVVTYTILKSGAAVFDITKTLPVDPVTSGYNIKEYHYTDNGSKYLIAVNKNKIKAHVWDSLGNKLPIVLFTAPDGAEFKFFTINPDLSAAGITYEYANFKIQQQPLDPNTLASNGTAQYYGPVTGGWIARIDTGKTGTTYREWYFADGHTAITPQDKYCKTLGASTYDYPTDKSLRPAGDMLTRLDFYKNPDGQPVGVGTRASGGRLSYVPVTLASEYLPIGVAATNLKGEIKAFFVNADGSKLQSQIKDAYGRHLKSMNIPTPNDNSGLPIGTPPEWKCVGLSTDQNGITGILWENLVYANKLQITTLDAGNMLVEEDPIYLDATETDFEPKAIARTNSGVELIALSKGETVHILPRVPGKTLPTTSIKAPAGQSYFALAADPNDRNACLAFSTKPDNTNATNKLTLVKLNKDTFGYDGLYGYGPYTAVPLELIPGNNNNYFTWYTTAQNCTSTMGVSTAGKNIGASTVNYLEAGWEPLSNMIAPTNIAALNAQKYILYAKTSEAALTNMQGPIKPSFQKWYKLTELSTQPS